MLVIKIPGDAGELWSHQESLNENHINYWQYLYIKKYSMEYNNVFPFAQFFDLKSELDGYWE